jgi:tetratricopeptide (TPR) repeat protein
MRVAFPLVTVVTTVAVLTLAGCSASKARIPPAPIDLSPRLAEADALLAAGCFDCLRDALQKYQSLRTVTAAPAPALERATVGALRAAALLALRQNELGMLDDGYLSTAKDLLALRPCNGLVSGCESLDRLLDIVGLLPAGPWGAAGRAPASDERMVEVQRLYRNREEWTRQLRDSAAQDELSAYTWLSFACGPGNGTRDETIAVLGPLRDVPLVQFKQVMCFQAQPNRLRAVIGADPRFLEVNYLLGFAAIGQLKLDEAEKAFEEAYEWQPRWPSLTLAMASLALTAEDFERSLALYDKTLELEPKAVDGVLGRVRALSYLGRPEAAIAAADELLRGRFYLGDARYWRAWNELQLDRLDAAWNDVELAARLLVNAQVPKLAGLIAYRRKQLDVARSKFEESLQRDPRDCDTGFYLGVVLADQRVWDRTASAFIGASSCLESAERDLRGEIENIRRSEATPERRARLIAKREQRIVATRRLLAQSTFNTAVAYFNLSRDAEARPFAEKVVDDEQFGERARDLLSYIK